MKKLLLLLVVAWAMTLAAAAQATVASRQWKTIATDMPSEWYASDEAKAVAENILLFQRPSGGWPKNIAMHRPLSEEQRAELAGQPVEKSSWNDGIAPTIDNDGTITEMRFMAKMYNATGDERYRTSFDRGLAYLLEAQYENGGWPQFYPLRKGYYTHITYNDNAQVNVMRLLWDIFDRKPEFVFVATDAVVAQARSAFDKGLDCILRSQVVIDGKPTVWCAQHDEVTLAPAGARTYELPSLSGSESVGIVELLMDLPEQTPGVKRAIEGAIAWFEAHKIEGIRVETRIEDGVRNRVVVEDASAPPIWGRFYDLETGKPFFCSRDGVKRATMAEISHERRNGYSWYTNSPQRLLDRYYASRPRVLVSTDIGGTDPDDNQSLAHLMMYTDRIRLEGIVSTPFSGRGSAEEIFRMIELYELDFFKLASHAPALDTPDRLRSITKQGARGAAPWVGYAEPTEGSEWIVECARREADAPLWVLVWGGLEDLAQALHDAPDIAPRIRVYWIGGPNKKWGANPYAYIAANFPDLFFVENNASYYGFFSPTDAPDAIVESDYYERHIAGAGHLGADFKNYYKGQVKMGDTPSLLYVMDGNPADPTGESWGGSFERFDHSPHVVFDRMTTLADTVAYCTVIEFQFEGPRSDMAVGTSCFWMDVPYGNRGEVQRWPGYYLGAGRYGIRYIPKVAETLTYRFTGAIEGQGAIVADNCFPGKRRPTDYPLGADWYTDRADPALYDGLIQGGKTTSKWRRAALDDWAVRWGWLK